MKCVIVLSSKSSGSSVLQRLIAQNQQVHFATWTEHNENETLYWTKAASILGMPQVKMLGSEVPIQTDRARTMMRKFLQQNLPDFALPDSDENLIYSGWKALCKAFGPVFVEKSPHHLLQWSALELMKEATQRLPEIDFMFIGLIRNPMDVLYSAWDRWRIPPAKKQFEWLQEYEHLKKCRGLFGKRLIEVRYEDLAVQPDLLAPVFKFIGEKPNAKGEKIHTRSIEKWRRDKWYGFRLDPAVQSLAMEFGYNPAQLNLDESRRIWPIYQPLSKAVFHACRKMKSLVPHN